MSWWRRLLERLSPQPSLGQRGERASARYLREQGYRILARNLRNRFGEVDIVAEAPDGRTIVIVEVKASEMSRPDELRPEVRVSRAKQHKLTALAGQLARRYALTDRPVRFDVIGISFDAEGKAEVRHHPAAFEATV